MTLLTFAESLLAGSTTGFLSGLLGVGGGFILVPLLTLLGMPIRQAVGTTLAFVACASLAGTVQHIRQGSIDLAVAWTLAVPAAVMTRISAHFIGHVSPATYFLLFGVLLLAVTTLYHFYPMSPFQQSFTSTPYERVPWYVLCRHAKIANVSYGYKVNVITAILSGLASGILTGFFGVGGGFLLVPLGVMLLHIPLQVAIGTCLAVAILPAWVGAFTHWQLGHVDVGVWVPLVVAGILSSQFGARCVLRFHPELLKRLFLLVLLLGATYMLARGLLWD